MVIAGPTLDSRYPQTWAAFTAGELKQCALLSNGDDDRGVPGIPFDVEFEGAGIEGQSPSAPEVFSVIDPPPAECATTLGLIGVVGDRPACSPGFALLLAEPGRATGCLIGLAVSDLATATDVTATLVYRFTITCTSATVAPCDDSRIERASPTTTDPVRVRWEQRTQVFACFADPDDTSPVDRPGTGSEKPPQQCPDRGGG